MACLAKGGDVSMSGKGKFNTSRSHFNFKNTGGSAQNT